VVTGGIGDGRVLAWDPAAPGAGPVELGRLEGSAAAVAVLPDGRVVTGGIGDGRVLAWDPAAPGAGPVELGRHDRGVRAMAVLPDARVVTGGDYDGRVLAWDPAAPGAGPVELGRHDREVSAVAVLPDGRVVTGGGDDRVRLRNVQSSSPGILLACSAYALAISLSSSGARLFIGHAVSGISCWEVRPGT
jgi:WD40 repeat protein